MNTDSPHLSVIMAVYNGERFIRAALQSIIQQNYQPLEIIVVDDGSTDSTAELVQAISTPQGVSLRYVYQSNQGQAAAFNHALRLVQGDVIGFLDADDLWVPNRLSKQLAKLATSSAGVGNAWIVLGRTKFFSDGVHVNPVEMEKANQRAFHYNLSASLFLKQVFTRVGGFDETMGFVSDWDWFVRAKEIEVPIAVLSEVTVLRRIHLENITRQRELGGKLTVQMIRNSLGRRRAQLEHNS